ncbi:MAG: soluble [2Fe-2S] ferredoxin, partial [uncultured Rubrobacteraceae bacterium]
GEDPQGNLPAQGRDHRMRRGRVHPGEGRGGRPQAPLRLPQRHLRHLQMPPDRGRDGPGYGLRARRRRAGARLAPHLHRQPAFGLYARRL